MSDVSTRLDLPFIAPSQAQKHVIHNEAIQRLDLLVQMRLDGFDATVPPAAPEPGAFHALGSGATGDWAGQDGQLAAFIGEVWMFIAPQEGWIAAESDGSDVRIYRDGDWRTFPDQLDQLGIGTSADAINRLALAADATLLSHAGAGHQLKINKAAVADTASLLFQSDWTGRAEMGLAGNNDFSIKVSADGVNWAEAVRVNAQTGRITGAAVQSGPTDSAAERLLKVGAFGLGTAVTLTSGDDLNAVLLSGLYYNPSAGNTTGNNYPVAVAGALLVIARSSTNVVQEYTTFAAGGAAADVRKFVRSHGLSGWSSWAELFHQGRLVGTVSQSGGMPTGAVIERGGNANGEYIRLADGTQICTAVQAPVDTTATSGSIFMHSNLLTWTYPASFTVSPLVSGGGGNTQRIVAPSTPGASICSYRVLSTINNATELSHGLLAIGRWF